MCMALEKLKVNLKKLQGGKIQSLGYLLILAVIIDIAALNGGRLTGALLK